MNSENSVDESDGNAVVYFVLVVSLILGVVLYLLKKKRSHQSILLVGCSNSGKTILYSDLIHNRSSFTYMSMKENVGLYKTKKRTFQLIDVPGHDRVRKSIIDQYNHNVRALIFMIDSKTIQTEIRDVAELLYSLCTDPIILSSCKDLLFVCNKQDLPEAKGTAVIKLLLEKELNVLRGLKTKLLDSTTNDLADKRMVFLGSPMKDFEFSQLKSMNISFIEAILKVDTNTKSGVDSISMWIQKL